MPDQKQTWSPSQFRTVRLATWLLAAGAAAAFCAPAHAQFGQGATGQQSTQAAPLPLSGRAAQSAGSVRTSDQSAPSTTATVNALSPNVQVQGQYAGSTRSTTPFNGKLGLYDAIRRGLSYNLGDTGATAALAQARGERRSMRSALLPNLNGTAVENVQTENLRAFGFRFSFPGFTIPSLIGPFNYTDVRAHVSQTVFDFTALNNYRAASEVAKANLYSAQDARELIVLGVGSMYLQVIAAKARLASEQAQLNSASAVYQQSLQQLQQGLIAKVDADRNEVQVLTHQQRLASLANDLAKEKITLARMIGLPVSDQYDITDEVPFAAAPSLTVDDALGQAMQQRADLKAAQSQMAAADRALHAARAERYPSLSASADVGGIGATPNSLETTYTATASLKIPIWQGGRTEGDIQQAQAALAQRRAEYEDTKGQIESDVRSSYLDLKAAESQVGVAQKNVDVNKEALDFSQQKVQAGVEDNVALVQAQEALENAQFDYIDALFAYNLAKLSLARATGTATISYTDVLKVP